MRFTIILTTVMRDAIDRWRRAQPQLVNRAEAARQLIASALRAGGEDKLGGRAHD
jgi:hypothetical protein